MAFVKSTLSSYAVNPRRVYGVGSAIGLGGGGYYAKIRRDPKVLAATELESVPYGPRVPLGASVSELATFDSVANDPRSTGDQVQDQGLAALAPAVAKVTTIEGSALAELKKKANQGVRKRKATGRSDSETEEEQEPKKKQQQAEPKKAEPKKKPKHSGGFNVV